MYVCICHGVTEKHIHQAVTDGADSMRKVRGCLGVGSQCGKCICHAQDVISQAQQEQIIPIKVEMSQKVA